MDWHDVWIVPLYKEKVECSLLSVVGKLYGRVLIKRV